VHELVAEIKQRVTQLENLLTRYNRHNHPPTKRITCEPGNPSSGVNTSTLCARIFK
jgi:hypothetical protein